MDSDIALAQRQGWFKSVELSVVDDDLCILQRVGHNEYNRKVPLATLDPNTDEATVRSRPLLYGSVAAAIMVGVFGWLSVANVGSGSDYPQLWIAAAAAAAITGLALFATYLLWVREHIWIFDGTTGAVAVRLDSRRPSRDEAQGFVQRLLAAAHGCRKAQFGQSTSPPGAYRAALELEKIHTLLRAGVLDREAFRTKKRVLLRCLLSGNAGQYNPETVVARIAQRQGRFRHRAFTLYPDRLEVEEESLLSRRRAFYYLQSLADNPDKRYLPGYGWAFKCIAALAGLSFFSLGALLEFMPAFRVVWLGIHAVVYPVPLLVVRWMRRRPRYVFLYRPGLSILPRTQPKPLLWLRDGEPSKAAVESFIQSLGRAHRDRQDENKPESAITAKFASLVEKEVISEEEFNDIRAKVFRSPRARAGLPLWSDLHSHN